MNNKTVNVDFVARAIEIDLNGKEHFIAAALAAEQAIKAKEESAASVALIKTRKVLWYENVAAMKADKSINAGSYVNTAGYYEPNDGGGAYYLIRSKTDADVENGLIYFLKNNLVAVKLRMQDNKYIANTADEVQFLLDAGFSVLINNHLILNQPIKITRNNVTLEFAHGTYIDMTNKNFAAIIVGDDTYRVEGLRLINPRTTGNISAGSIGIYVHSMGYNSEIVRPLLTGVEKGIQTHDFDCMQINAIYEPYIGSCKIGIDDTKGGMQACRIYGGRIEQNNEYGVVSASPNVHYIGCVIEGNGNANVKLLNTYSDKYGTARWYPSGGTFDNCYFEVINEECVVKLGDETQNNGWYGNVTFLGCQSFNHNVPMIKCDGNAVTDSGGISEKHINIIGGVISGTYALDLQNVSTDTSINVSDCFYNGTTDITENINASAKLSIKSDRSINISHWCKADLFCGKGKNEYIAMPASIMYSKIFRLEDTQSTSNGTYTHITYSSLKPWEDSNVGILVGSIHICSTDGKIYVRVTNNWGTDDSTKWKALAFEN